MFGDQVRKLRTAKGLSQVQLAKELNVSKQSVSNWENNNITPSIDLLTKIAHYFSCSSDYLLEIEYPDSTKEELFIETQHLTLRQIAHLQQIAEDFKELNIAEKEQK